MPKQKIFFYNDEIASILSTKFSQRRTGCRYGVLVFFLLLTSLLSAQSSIKVGTELSTNLAVPRGGAPGINVFMKWKKHDVYLGFNDYLNWLYPGASSFDALGFETGYKYHFLGEKRRSHFYSEFNIQHYAYSSGGGPSASYNYDNFFVGYPATFNRNWILNSSLQFGYEKFFLSWLSLNVSTGIGFQYDKFSERDYLAPNYSYHVSSELYYIVVPIKLGLRFTVGFKKNEE